MKFMVIRGVYDVLSLYMLLILLRWAAPWLQLDLWSRRFRWICRLTDPLTDWIRRRLPSMGPLDFAPWVLLFGVWLIREMSVGILAGAGPR